MPRTSKTYALPSSSVAPAAPASTISSADFNALTADIVTALNTAGPLKLSDFNATTSAELAGVISDETGTGALVFANAPTLVNPVVGTQSPGNNTTRGASTAFVAAAITAIGASVVTTRTAMAALASTSVVILNETGREGVFVWKTGNQSTHITNDPGQGFYVPPTSDTTGASGSWVRVTDNPTTCLITWFGAVGNGSTDNYTAIQRAIDYLYNTYGGGTINFTNGNYIVSNTLVMRGTIVIDGNSREGTVINGSLQDLRVLYFDSTCNYAEIKNVFVFGYPNTAATNPVVDVYSGIPVNYNNCKIWGGNAALRTAGVDGRMYNCYLSSWASSGSCVLSSGANWYENCKIDNSNPGFAGFQQTARDAGLSGPMENSFTDTDFSGAYSYSVYVDDGGQVSAMSKFCGGCVFSAPIGIINAKWSGFSTAEFGSTTLGSVAPISIVGSYAFAATTVTGGGTKSLGGNINIS